MDNFNCSGKDILKYAGLELAEANYESAIYLSCIAELESKKRGDKKTKNRAVLFTQAIIDQFKSHIKYELHKYGISSDQENLKELVVQYNDLARIRLREVLEEFVIKVNEVPEDLVSRVKEAFNGMVA